MKRRALRRLSLLLLALTLLAGVSACKKGEGSGLAGMVLFQDQPLSGAQIEIYLKEEQDRATLPFATTSSDAAGRYRIALPTGRYYLIAKKKVEGSGGPTRMLMAAAPLNPLDLQGGSKEVAPFNLREMGRDGALVAEAGTGVKGRIVHDNQPVANAFVYVYSEKSAGLIGPSYGEAVRSAADGTFTIPLPAGNFYLAARKRADGARSGDVAVGDLNGLWSGNPLTLNPGKTIDLGDFSVSIVKAESRKERLEQGKFAPTDTTLRGRMVDQDGKAVGGVYAFAYLDSRMVGKPVYISAATGDDGRFELRLSDGGTYYIGARSTFGGPLEPGEWVGTYDARPNHMVAVKKGEVLDLDKIVVREVW
ncbi:MAG: hypothetical protein Q7U44_03770 [Desulfuromonadales bacterium]|nr:hypothetical protein [Desulfuromonadales bacterium]